MKALVILDGADNKEWIMIKNNHNYIT